jgi:hypothetical protein
MPALSKKKKKKKGGASLTVPSSPLQFFLRKQLFPLRNLETVIIDRLTI